MDDPFKTYIQSLQADLARGNASEHTYRSALKTLLESLGERLTATNEPRQVTDCGIRAIMGKEEGFSFSRRTHGNQF